MEQSDADRPRVRAATSDGEPRGKKKRASSLIPADDDDFLGAPRAARTAGSPESMRRVSIASTDSRRHSLSSVINAVSAVSTAVKRPSLVAEAVSRVSHIGSERSKRNDDDPKIQDVCHGPSASNQGARDPARAIHHPSLPHPCVWRSFATSRQRSSSRCGPIGLRCTICASARCSGSRAANTPSRGTRATE